MSATINGAQLYVVPTYVYKIRRRSDGLFSSGGMWPKFGPKGKTWSTIGLLNQHLALFSEYSHSDDKGYHYKMHFPKAYLDCDVLKLETRVRESFDVVGHIKARFPDRKITSY